MIGPQLAAELLDAISLVRRDPQARALVVAANGPVFCAGADLPRIFGQERPTAQMRAALRAYYESFLQIRALAIPTFAAVDGPGDRRGPQSRAQLRYADCVAAGAVWGDLRANRTPSGRRLHMVSRRGARSTARAPHLARGRDLGWHCGLRSWSRDGTSRRPTRIGDRSRRPRRRARTVARTVDRSMRRDRRTRRFRCSPRIRGLGASGIDTFRRLPGLSLVDLCGRG